MEAKFPKVSIIIPVYKVQAYIERCIRSLFSQTLDSLEYIFIDDCGGDASFAILQRILKEYPERVEQVKIIKHAYNKGVSKSRQEGVDMASGSYIIHCDPDDWVEVNMYELLYNEAINQNADIVFCDYNMVTDKETKPITQKPHDLTGLSLLQSICGVHEPYLHGGLVNKLIKTSLFKKVRFPKNINFCEDVVVLFQLLKIESLKIHYVDYSLYNYKVDRPGSICKSVSLKDIEMDNSLIDLMYQSNAQEKKYNICMYSFIINTIFNRAFLLGELTDRQFSLYYKKYYEYIRYNLRIKALDKALLKLAMKGNMTIARFMYYKLIKFKKLVHLALKR